MFLLLDDTTSTEVAGLFPIEIEDKEHLFIGDLDHKDSEHRRWLELLYASKGARLFTDDPDRATRESPIYAGPAPKSLGDIRKVLSDLKYSENRSQYFRSFGVNYIGRSYVIPRTVVVLDNKASNKDLSSLESPEHLALYSSLPDDWWGSCGFVSTANVDRLGEFLEEIPDAMVLAYSKGALAKLKYLGVPHAAVDAPPEKANENYGIYLREKANRLAYDLSPR